MGPRYGVAFYYGIPLNDDDVLAILMKTEKPSDEERPYGKKAGGRKNTDGGVGLSCGVPLP